MVGIFRLKQRHLAALAAPFRLQFERELLERYGAIVSVRGVLEAEQRRQVSWLVGRAERYGLRRLQSQCLFVLLAADFGPFFDEHPAVTEYLSRAGAGNDAVFAGVVEAVPATTWIRLTDAAFHAQWMEVFDPTPVASLLE